MLKRNPTEKSAVPKRDRALFWYTVAMTRRFQKTAIALLLLAGAFFSPAHPVHAQELSPAQRAELQAQYDQLQKEIEQQQQIIKETQAQKQSLQGDVTTLNAKIKAAQAQIDAKNIVIKQLSVQIAQKNVVIGKLNTRIENGKVGRQLRRHRGQRLTRGNRQMRERRPAVLDVCIRVIAVFARDLQERVLHRDAAREPARHFIADRLADDEPRLADRRRIDDVGNPDAARETVEHAPAAGMRITAHEQRTRQRVAVIRHELMADALIVADVVKALDAELPHEFARGLVRGRAGLVGRGRAMIEHDDHALRIGKSLDPAPAVGREHRIDEHHRIDADRDEVAGTDLRLPRFAGENFFGQRPAHSGRFKTE